MNARIAIVVLTVDQRERTLRLLRSLVHDDARARILVWDNGSTDGTDDAVRREFPAVHVHRHPTNLGVASGRNSGAALAIERYQPTHLLFLDNDMVVQHGFVNALLEPFRHWTMAGPAIVAAAAALTALLILWLHPFLVRYAMARPNARSSHTVPTPQGGGIAVIASHQALGIEGLRRIDLAEFAA